MSTNLNGSDVNDLDSTKDGGNEWGWEAMGSEDENNNDTNDIDIDVAGSSSPRQNGNTSISNSNSNTNIRNNQQQIVQNKSSSSSNKASGLNNLNKSSSFVALKNNSSFSNNNNNNSNNKPLKGITSSPSFQELEKAIAMSLEGEGAINGEEAMNPLSSSNSRLSSTNLTQQKLQQQRMRQQQNSNYHQRNNNYSNHNNINTFFNSNVYQMSPNQQSPQYHYSRSSSFGNIANMIIPSGGPSAREELASFINESESRAIVVFHSPQVSSVTIRNACSKFGVLYYIRPEFHGRGVTLISYFDLRAAISCKASIAEEIGSEYQVSAHFSVMLHAGNSNSEEFRLVVRNLPPVCDGSHSSESEVQNIFSRYGQLRSIQKTFGNDKVAGPGQIEAIGQEEDVGLPLTSNVNVNVNESSNNNNSCPPYSIEYYNIQDARLAVSELSATSVTLWSSETTVKFAPLDSRKQQLCRLLLATLSKWRTEMASSVVTSSSVVIPSSPLSSPVMHHHPHHSPHMSMSMHHPGMQFPMPMPMPPHLQQQQQQQVPLSPNHHPHQVMFMPMQPHMGMMSSVGLMGSNGNLAAMNMMPIMTSSSSNNNNNNNNTSSGVVGVNLTLVEDNNNNNNYFHPNNNNNNLQFDHTLDNLGDMQYHTKQNMYNNNNNVYGSGGQQQQQPYYPSSQSMMMNSSNATTTTTDIHQQQQSTTSFNPSPRQSQQSQQSIDIGGGGTHHHETIGKYNNNNNSSMDSTKRSSSSTSSVPRGGGGVVGYPSLSSSDSPSIATGTNNTSFYSDHHRPHHHNGGHAQHHHHHQLLHHQQQHQQASSPSYSPIASSSRMSISSNTGRGSIPISSMTMNTTNKTGGGGGGGGFSHIGNTNPNIDVDFALDLTRIGEDKETRTTIMVRNIPNKYNQQMLLEEVNENHEGTYDFFYLPIDFKNRCNVGYCFINFLDPKFIPPFVHEFNGQRWKSFNSEKVCAVSFARIQGKSAMIARFQNSSLLEKDDEYQPLLFYSNGPDRGKPEPFPHSNKQQLYYHSSLTGHHKTTTHHHHHDNSSVYLRNSLDRLSLMTNDQQGGGGGGGI